jgi:predicted acyl esterase
MTTANRTTTSACVFLLIGACAMLAVRPGRARAQAPPDERYEIVTTRNVMVASRDGVRLATDIYAPGRGGTTTGRSRPLSSAHPLTRTAARTM